MNYPKSIHEIHFSWACNGPVSPLQFTEEELDQVSSHRETANLSACDLDWDAFECVHPEPKTEEEPKKIDGLDEAVADLLLPIINGSSFGQMLLSENEVIGEAQWVNQQIVDESQAVSQPLLPMAPAEQIPSGDALTLLAAPFPYQRTRYTSEFKEGGRSIFVEGNECIVLQMTGIDRSQLSPRTVWIRVTRTTLEYGPNKEVFHHPYPLHVKNGSFEKSSDSWFIPLTDAIMREQKIKIEKLFMLRLKQGSLANIRQLSVFTAATLEGQETHTVTAGKGKEVRDRYDLRHSRLHFQVCLRDENNKMRPTNATCWTEPIYEYEASEYKNLPEPVQQLEKPKQRKGRKPIDELNATSSKRKKVDGPYPPSI